MVINTCSANHRHGELVSYKRTLDGTAPGATSAVTWSEQWRSSKEEEEVEAAAIFFSYYRPAGSLCHLFAYFTYY